MKQFLTFVALAAITFTSYSQSLGYTDLGILFGQDNNYGTSRFNAMSGAFGALGSDISSIGINPAGAAVATTSKFSITLGNKKTDINANYYNNTTNSLNDSFSISQAGAILTFDTNRNRDWNRFAMSFNYRLKNDFNENFSINGNSGEAFYNVHPNDTADPQIEFNNAQGQNFQNNLKGESSVMSMGFSAAHQNKLFVGATLNIHNTRFSQINYLDEINQDINGNELTVLLDQDTFIESSGFSLGLGFIYKLHQNFRIGLAYETPTWRQEVIEDFVEDYSTKVTGINDFSERLNQLVAYSLRTPGKLTASGAIIFDKQGLISLDYTYKDYRNTKFTSNGFNDANNSFTTDYRATHTVNIGTEWRFDRMSLRAGYHYEQSPLLNALDNDNLKGYSAGLGYNFGNLKFDLAYRQSETNSPYSIYNDASINPIELNTNTSRITGTVTFNL